MLNQHVGKRFWRGFFTACVVAFGASPALAQEAAAEDSGSAGSLHEYTSEELNFSMILPEDWEVMTNTGGLEFFAQPKEKSKPTKENPVVADPNITVAASKNPMPIDEISLGTYATEIETGLKKTVGEDSGLEVFMKKLVDVNDTRKGLLYYLRYFKGDYTVFNAILVVSSATHVFRVTLTDYEVTFDANLEKLYPFMASIDVGQTLIERPSLLEVATPWLATLIGFLVILFGGRMVMLRMAQNRLRGDLSDSAYESEHSVAPISRAVQFKSGAESVYDPEFRESHEASGYGGEQELTEVPLSQALGEDSGYYGRRQPLGSVGDPESEFGGAPSSMIYSQADSEAPTQRAPKRAPEPPPSPKAQSSVPKKAPPPPPPPKPPRRDEPDPSAMSRVGSNASSETATAQSEFGFSRAPDEDDA